MKKVKGIGLLAIILLLGGLVGSLAGPKEKNSMNWLTPEQMSSQYVISKRPIIVDVYTSWCHYCKVMDNTTWQNDSVTAYLKDRFYTVKIDAENQSTYQWMGEKFDFIPKYKLNQLAIKLLQGNMVYPSIVIIPENGEPEILKGAFSAAQMEMVLKYYGGKWNETSNPRDFQSKFSGTWK